MKTIILPRGAGKTDALIRLAASNDGYIAVRSKEQASLVSNRAKALGLKIRFPVTYDDTLSAWWNSEIVVMIDNAEAYIDYMCTGNVAAITITSDEN